MARNRQRARERKQRQRDNNAPEPEQQQPGPEPEPEHVPDAFEHSSSSIDEVNAALQAGVPREAGNGGFVEIDDEEFEREKADIAADLEAPPPPKKPGLLARTLAFLRACWAELQRVQWPDRRQVGQATAVVLGFVVVAGAFLGLADVVAQKIVDYIL